MKTDSGYVLKNSDGLYFIGFNQAGTHLREARIYYSERWARESREQINSNNHRMDGVKHDFELVKVEITEVESEEYERGKNSQELVLDKIRAEIEQERVGYPPSADYYKAIIKCLQIIDKYRAESEEE